ncbi:MAG: hypothetical protein MRY49_02865 [Candidatus Pacebacteria bacterium]|nr:hypothetical protein [Candidatus Paceibacterota bacterium]
MTGLKVENCAQSVVAQRGRVRMLRELWRMRKIEPAATVWNKFVSASQASCVFSSAFLIVLLMFIGECGLGRWLAGLVVVMGIYCFMMLFPCSFLFCKNEIMESWKKVGYCDQWGYDWSQSGKSCPECGNQK